MSLLSLPARSKPVFWNLATASKDDSASPSKVLQPFPTAAVPSKAAGEL